MMKESLRQGMCLFGWGLGLVGLAVSMQADDAARLQLVWPTPNPAWLQGAPLEAYIQPTASREITSGLFGSVRRGGYQFHEGIDLGPVRRDARGEALDEIYAVMDGVVRHVSARAGDSSYGRYLVLEHPGTEPGIYTLYSHLATFAPGIEAGRVVARGQVLGIMGRSAGGYVIPPERAHLHFEMGLRLTDDFASWYEWKKFTTPNRHDRWNGMNLMGFDPLDFYNRFRGREVNHFGDYLRTLEEAVVVRVAIAGRPDFVRRYPSLVRTPEGGEPMMIAGWEVQVDQTGLPYAWTPLSRAELGTQRAGEVKVVRVDRPRVEAFKGKKLVTFNRRGTAVPAQDLQTMLQLVFGMRR